jgi:peptidylprolyl isomerase
LVVTAALPLSGCGGGGAAALDTSSVPRPSAKSPPIHAPASLPTSLVIRDRTKGKGAVVPPVTNHAEVEIATLYTAIDSRTGELYEERQDPNNPYEVEFGANLDVAWEEGLPGMRVGGRRELIAPASTTFENLPLVYVIDLVRVAKIGSAGQDRPPPSGS